MSGIDSGNTSSHFELFPENTQENDISLQSDDKNRVQQLFSQIIQEYIFIKGKENTPEHCASLIHHIVQLDEVAKNLPSGVRIPKIVQELLDCRASSTSKPSKAWQPIFDKLKAAMQASGNSENDTKKLSGVTLRKHPKEREKEISALLKYDSHNSMEYYSSLLDTLKERNNVKGALKVIRDVLQLEGGVPLSSSLQRNLNSIFAEDGNFSSVFEIGKQIIQMKASPTSRQQYEDECLSLLRKCTHEVVSKPENIEKFQLFFAYVVGNREFAQRLGSFETKSAIEELLLEIAKNGEEALVFGKSQRMNDFINSRELQQIAQQVESSQKTENGLAFWVTPLDSFKNPLMVYLKKLMLDLGLPGIERIQESINSLFNKAHSREGFIELTGSIVRQITTLKNVQTNVEDTKQTITGLLQAFQGIAGVAIYMKKTGEIPLGIHLNNVECLIRERNNEVLQKRFNKVKAQIENFSFVSSNSPEHLEDWMTATSLELQKLGQLIEEDPLKSAYEELQKSMDGVTSNFVEEAIEERKKMQECLEGLKENQPLFENLKEFGDMLTNSSLFSSLATFKASMENSPGFEAFAALYTKEPLSSLMAATELSFQVKTSLDSLVQQTSVQRGGEVLLYDDKLQSAVEGHTSFASLKSLGRKKFWKEVKRIAAGERERAFVIRPFFVGKMIHASINHIEDRKLKEGHIISEYTDENACIENSVVAHTFEPHIEKLLTSCGKNYLKSLYPPIISDSEEKLYRQINYRFQTIVSRICRDEIQDCEMDAHKAMKSILPSLPSITQRSKEEERTIPQNVFCSEFVARLLQIAVRELDYELSQELKEQGITTPAKFFHPIVSRRKSFEKISPKGLLDVIKGIYTEKEASPFLQLLFAERRKS